MKVTIDKLIEKLNEAKKITGGDAEVQFYESPDHTFVLTDGMFGIDQPIERKISQDKTYVAFEIDHLPES